VQRPPYRWARHTCSARRRFTLADLADLSKGGAVLDTVDEFLARFIAYPNEYARHAHTLRLAHAWRMEVWDFTPRLAFMSPKKGSGKFSPTVTVHNRRACLTTKDLRCYGRDGLSDGNCQVALSQNVFQNSCRILTCSETFETLAAWQR
jgi:hypothetical protein